MIINKENGICILLAVARKWDAPLGKEYDLKYVRLEVFAQVPLIDSVVSFYFLYKLKRAPGTSFILFQWWRSYVLLPLCDAVGPQHPLYLLGKFQSHERRLMP